MIYERIEKSLNQAIKLHNSGVGANDSIIKVAKDNELNPETICRVVEAFNIAKTKAYVKVAEDKAGDFDVADKKEVIKRVFENSSVEPKTASVVDDLFGERDNFKYEEFDGNYIEETIKVSSTSEVSLDDRIKKAYQAIEEQEREIEERKKEIVLVKEAFYTSLKQLTDSLSYTEEREKVADAVAEVFYEHGENKRAGKVLHLISKCANLKFDEMTEKLGGAHSPTTGTFVSCFNSLVESDEEYSKLAKEFNETLKQAKDGQEELMSLVKRAGGIHSNQKAAKLIGSKKSQKLAKNENLPEDLLNDVLGSLFKDKKAQEKLEKKIASTSFLKISNAGGSAKIPNAFDPSTYSTLQLPSGKDLWSKGYELRLKKKTDPMGDVETSREIEGIKRQTILAELLNDEIISQQNPEDVISAYNTMIQLAPNASLVKDVAKSVLRQGTAQVIDPHFASTLTELELSLLKTQNFTPGQKQ
jgi:hypothetical protein